MWCNQAVAAVSRNGRCFHPTSCPCTSVAQRKIHIEGVVMAKVIFQDPWNYTLYDTGSEWIVTLLIGGVADIPVSVRLTAGEIEAYKKSPGSLDALVEAVKADRKAFANRELVPVYTGGELPL
jgi:hypothetical protein